MEEDKFRAGGAEEPTFKDKEEDNLLFFTTEFKPSINREKNYNDYDNYEND